MNSLWLSCLTVVAAVALVVGGGGEAARRRERPVVHLEDQGMIRGSKAPDGNYYQFKGIPYATASPRYRFQNKLPVPKWEGVKDADRDVACSQPDDKGGVAGTEDCLVVNVYTPRVSSAPHKRRAVMVFIHGGSFNQGSAEKFIYGPKKFMEENVVLVTFNYRLGIFGFLCSGELANAGLKDAVAVLEWVKTNIHKFGGDPEKVTLFGQSSGSVLVEILALSKRTEGLIGGAILQSGVTSSPWAFGSDPAEKLRRIAADLGYDGNDNEQRIGVLRNASVTDLITAQEKLALMTPFEFLPVTPCVEPVHAPEAILTSSPHDIFRSGDYPDIPRIIGVTQNESMLLYGLVAEMPSFYQYTEDEFLYSLPADLQRLPCSDEISNKTRQYYFDNNTISNESMTQLVEYFTDVTYGIPMVQNARNYIRSEKLSPVYVYRFCYDGGMPYFKILLNITEIPGVCHADELAYMFSIKNFTLTQNDDLLLSKKIVKLWTNFAKFRDPTPTVSQLLPVKWAPMNENLEYLYIDRKIVLNQKPFPDRVDYWDGVYQTCNINP